MDPNICKSQGYRVGYQSNKKLLRHYQHAKYQLIISMQNISKIHKFTLKILRILVSHELKGQAYPKIIVATLRFPEFYSIIQKVSLFQLLILEIHSILESHNQINHTHF